MSPIPSSPTQGIIPARAGFTKCSISDSKEDKDHPRSRGVYLINVI